MKTFETSATVEDQGRLHVNGVPFAPGTEVQVTVRERTTADASGTPTAEEVHASRERLFACLDKARNTESVVPAPLPDESQTLLAARERMRHLFATVRGFRMTPKLRREDLYDRHGLR